MILAEAQIEFRCGTWKSARATPSLDRSGWYLTLYSKQGTPVMLQRQRGGECVYKTLDAAYSAARKIGFRTLMIETPSTD